MRKEDPLQGISNEGLQWIGRHRQKLRQQYVEDYRLYFQSLGTGFAIGFVAHVIGYLLKGSHVAEPFSLLADLLYAFGYALWTGVVVALFVQVLPERKRRQIKRTLDAYDKKYSKPSSNIKTS